MKAWKTMQPVLLLLLISGCVYSYTHSCEDIKNNYLGSKFVSSLIYACVVVQEGYSNYEQLNMLHLTADRNYSLANIASSDTHCVEHSWDTSWTLTSDVAKDFDCTQEFTLILSNQPPTLVLPEAKPTEVIVNPGHQISFVAPQTGLRIRKKSCTGIGNVTFSTGSGIGESELLYEIREWPCSSVPEWIFSFDIVDTIRTATGVAFTVEASTDIHSTTNVSPGERIAILSSGRSNDQQNLVGSDNHATFHLSNGLSAEITANLDLKFDPSNTGYVELIESNNGIHDTYIYYNITKTAAFVADSFEVLYLPKGLTADQIYRNQDTVIIELSIGEQASTMKTTTSAGTAKSTLTTITQTKPTAPPLPSSEGPYCACGVDKFGFPSGWNYNDIWLDIVFILDTSEAMSEESINDASSLIESFISDGDDDFLITDTTAPFYSRVGVISMSDAATVLYNLNMTKSDKVQVSRKKGVKEINVVDAFNAALIMFNDGLTSDREYTRQVVYYITDSDAKDNLNSLDDFKNTKGAVIVNNFLQDGEVERPGLRDLASEGYYFLSSNYMQGLQAFCKANCFCKPGKDTYGGADPAIKAAGGCYHATSAGVPFNKAKSSCSTEGGIIAADHDSDKGNFLQQLMTKSSKSDYFWIGYDKSDDGVWQWDDQSSDSYTNWDVNEPSSAAVAKCAYVDTTNPTLPWGAGNCQLGFPYVCQYVPCSVGYKNC